MNKMVLRVNFVFFKEKENKKNMKGRI